MSPIINQQIMKYVEYKYFGKACEHANLCDYIYFAQATLKAC